MIYDFEQSYDPIERKLVVTLWIDRDNFKNEVITHRNLTDDEIDNMDALIEKYKGYMIERYDYAKNKVWK